jgi:hypothetical protein
MQYLQGQVEETLTLQSFVRYMGEGIQL